MSSRTVSRLCEKGKVPSFKIGRAVRIPKKALHECNVHGIASTLSPLAGHSQELLCSMLASVAYDQADILDTAASLLEELIANAFDEARSDRSNDAAD